MYRRFGKRFFDIAASTCALVVLSPLMLLVAVAIKLEDRGPVIYQQKRVGQNGDLFEFLKFRSMPVAAESIESRRAENLPITRVGRVIRRTSIDELPQLVDVLRGDMSVVGPRPPLPSQAELIELRRENGSLAVRPGLTGLAQINSYDQMPVPEKAKWDGEYASHISLGGDFEIILKTFAYLRKPPPSY
jgi:O-antigen biosynthesis protein WbqP